MRSLGSSLLFGAGVVLRSSAQPSVNVALHTAFGSPPYLVELLETAADENATAYFPLLDRIADGYFDSASTDQELYTKFRSLLQTEGHLHRGEDLSSFDLALSLRSTAPKIEAHYQYYNSSVNPYLEEKEEDSRCQTWLHTPFSGQRFCSPALDSEKAQKYGEVGQELRQLPFDRVLGDIHSRSPSVLYADITSQSFRQFHKTISKTAKAGKSSYRIRYKPAAGNVITPLAVSGYGVELALKRTDYIVIDDRQDGDAKEDIKKATDTKLSEEEVSDLRPLSSSEVARLGVKAASFVLASDDPFDTLLRLSEDFPKHSTSIAATEESEDFVKEHIENRDMMVPAGYSVMWINGVQKLPRDIDAYALLEDLRRERKMINGVRELGLSAPEAIDLLAHEAITESSMSEISQRYDWRDDNDGGNVIMWLNDIEKDKRYEDWPKQLVSLLQRTFPGQLPSVRRNIHHLVLPIDFADYADVVLLVDQLQNFVKRKVPVRIGLVPRSNTLASVEQAKVAYHLLETYGLTTVLEYLGKSVEGAGRKYAAPEQKYFQNAIHERKVRRDKTVMTLEDVSNNADINTRIESSTKYLARLGAEASPAPIFINGVPIVRNDEWMQSMSQQVSKDLRAVQEAVYGEKVDEDYYVPDMFLADATHRRNALIMPETDDSIRHLDLAKYPEIADLPSLPNNKDSIERETVHLTVAADVDSLEGFEQVLEAVIFQKEHDNVELAVLHVPARDEKARKVVLSRLSAAELQRTLHGYDLPSAEAVSEYDQRRNVYKTLFDTLQAGSDAVEDAEDTTRLRYNTLISAVDIQPGQKAVILNGRIVGPVSTNVPIETADLESLYDYERKKRLLPAALAIQGLKIEDKASTAVSFARISNLIALSQVSDVPEGIFEAAPTVRTGVFKQWNSTHTAIKVGNIDTAVLQIYALVDPASEIAQRWAPILKTLSELDGVYVCIYLNPKDTIKELPVKRFYRHVLSSKPSFSADGALQGHSAKFTGLPADALLNMGMDLPPSWLVAPEESIHDLDNIKLSAVKSGTDIEAVYRLENILIEGHSRDVTLGPPPRGAQLTLGTESNPHLEDTIIMANLGYFQFKANPGVYDLALLSGRSQEIFNIDSAGTLGYAPQPGDNGTDIAMTSFRGVTLFPRLSRRPGMEEEDVLEAPKSALESMAENADKLLSQAGLASKYLSKAAKIGSKLLSPGSEGTALSAKRHAEINIFSVASGHLYERMLNIMMVSVMKHTKHTVKFWFIEQFLSPSFKKFLPVMAEEYGFKYELVTYKWPHWLRGQKEKQREIWGYKILFLDVLFPLDLDKVVFVDADQIVRTDMYELIQYDLKGAPYGFTPMCDSRTEMEGFRFWKQGYWKSFLRGLPYHISALYVVDLKKFRQIAAGDRLRQQYHQLSADPNSLSNLDQDLPNHMQAVLPIQSLPQDWLWCETWCSDEALKTAKTIDLCNNPQTKEPKLDRARRQVPEWTEYDNEIAQVAKKHKESQQEGEPVARDAQDAGPQGEEEESIQERLQREDAAQEQRKKSSGGHDEL